MLRRPARELEASREIAVLIAGDESPEWLAKLIYDILDGIKFSRLIDRMEPTRAELRSEFDEVVRGQGPDLSCIILAGGARFLGTPSAGRSFRR